MALEIKNAVHLGVPGYASCLILSPLEWTMNSTSDVISAMWTPLLVS